MHKDCINAYKNSFQKEKYNRVVILLHKDTDILSRLESLVILTGKSRNSIIVEAIENYLDQHGIKD